MEVFTMDYAVAPEGLTTQALFQLLQDAAGAQCVPLRLAWPDLEQRGLMWVIVRYRVELVRWPSAGEALRLHTWPGEARHGMMPRFFTLRSAAGEALLRASSVWAVVDRATRRMVSGEDFGVHLDALVTGEELALPGAVRRLPTEHEADFTVPAAYLDANGHMNNTFYYTVAEDCLGSAARRALLRELVTAHQSEALCGETLRLRWGEKDGLCYVTGEKDGKSVFKMNLRYDI